MTLCSALLLKLCSRSNPKTRSNLCLIIWQQTTVTDHRSMPMSAQSLSSSEAKCQDFKKKFPMQSLKSKGHKLKLKNPTKMTQSSNWWSLKRSRLAENPGLPSALKHLATGTRRRTSQLLSIPRATTSKRKSRIAWNRHSCSPPSTPPSSRLSSAPCKRFVLSQVRVSFGRATMVIIFTLWRQERLRVVKSL